MNAQELKNAYRNVYNYMAESKDPKNMKAFGNVMTDMYDWYAENKPEVAQEWLDRLSAIKWEQYLTPKEAEAIISKMQPKAPWGREAWNNAMSALGLTKEEEPYYNRCALWVAMNMIYSDHAETLAENVLNKPLPEVPSELLVKSIHALALDLLRDKDGVFSIRSYFGL